MKVYSSAIPSPWKGIVAASIAAVGLAASIQPASATEEETSSEASSDKPNILVIMGDDIGWFNTSAYNSGMMGYTTPNIDSIAEEGIRFTDAYGQQSCTAGRAAFITGQVIGVDGGIVHHTPYVADMLEGMSRAH